MTQSAQSVIKKINFVRTSRKMLADNIITEYPPIPQQPDEESETIRNLMFAYLKQKFPGCKIRPANSKFSVRLDADMHKKARKLRSVILGNQEWRRWFEQNHTSILREINNNNNSFMGSSSVCEYREEEGNHFIHVRTDIQRIYRYQSDGLLSWINWMNSEYQKDVRLNAIYDRTVQIMESEISRREQARRDRIAREQAEYLRGVQERLIKQIRSGSFDRNGINVEDKFKARMFDYCTERGITPQYAEEITPENMLPIDTNVRIIARQGQREADWYAVPMFGGYEVPEGYMLRDRWGKVTSFDRTNPRSNNGQSPIVVENYIYVGFDPQFWSHTIPANHAELLEVSREMMELAKADAAEARAVWEAEQARLRAEEARREAERQEQARIAHEERKRQREAELEEERKQLRERLNSLRAEDAPVASEKPTPAPAMPPRAEPATSFWPVPDDEDGEIIEEVESAEEPQRYTQEELDAAAQLRAQLARQLTHRGDQVIQQLNDMEHPAGVYRNERGIPLERYVVVHADGHKEFFREVSDAKQLGRSLRLEGDRARYIHDYWNIDRPVDHLR